MHPRFKPRVEHGRVFYDPPPRRIRARLAADVPRRATLLFSLLAAVAAATGKIIVGPGPTIISGRA